MSIRVFILGLFILFLGGCEDYRIDNSKMNNLAQIEELKNEIKQLEEQQDLEEARF